MHVTLSRICRARGASKVLVTQPSRRRWGAHVRPKTLAKARKGGMGKCLYPIPNHSISKIMIVPSSQRQRCCLMFKTPQRGGEDPGKAPGPDSMVLGTGPRRPCSNYFTKAKQAEQSGEVPKSVPVSRECPHKSKGAGIRPHKGEGVA